MTSIGERSHAERSRVDMDGSRSRIPIVLALGAGVLIGWAGSGFRATPMQASSTDRAGDCIVTTGAVLMQYDDSTKAPVPLEALYFLDYKGGRLLATIPSYRQAGSKMQLIDGFVERDLVADFKLSLETRAQPRFLMATGSLGRYSSGWAPLYVFETTTGQVAVYKMQVGQNYGESGAGQFELVELRRYNKSGGEPARP
jgi:hypothetical protein